MPASQTNLHPRQDSVWKGNGRYFYDLLTPSRLHLTRSVIFICSQNSLSLRDRFPDFLRRPFVFVQLAGSVKRLIFVRCQYIGIRFVIG